MTLFELLLLIVLGFSAIILLIIAGLCLKTRCFPSKRLPPTGFTVGGDEENEMEHAQFLQRSTSHQQDNRSRIELEIELDTRSLRTNPSTTDLRYVLTSRPSAPVLSSAAGNGEGTRRFYRKNSRQNVYSSTTSIHHRPLEDIRQHQNDLLTNGIKFNYQDAEYNLIIAIDASEEMFGGYCVDLREKTIEFYSINFADVPWRDCSEFEMKNFLFAQMLWSEKIKAARKIQIYTGYRAQNYDNNRFGRRACKLLEHYIGCEGISVGNLGRHHVSYVKDPKAFAVYVQPASDLTSEEFKAFVEFILQYYDIDLSKLEGSHDTQPTVTEKLVSSEYEATKNYHIYIDEVSASMKAWTSPCPKCAYVDDHTASVLSLNRISS